jgi:hypothetical protein
MDFASVNYPMQSEPHRHRVLEVGSGDRGVAEGGATVRAMHGEMHNARLCAAAGKER